MNYIDLAKDVRKRTNGSSQSVDAGSSKTESGKPTRSSEKVASAVARRGGLCGGVVADGVAGSRRGGGRRRGHGRHGAVEDGGESGRVVTMRLTHTTSLILVVVRVQINRSQ